MSHRTDVVVATTLQQSHIMRQTCAAIVISHTSEEDLSSEASVQSDGGGKRYGDSDACGASSSKDAELVVRGTRVRGTKRTRQALLDAAVAEAETVYGSDDSSVVFTTPTTGSVESVVHVVSHEEDSDSADDDLSYGNCTDNDGDTQSNGDVTRICVKSDAASSVCGADKSSVCGEKVMIGRSEDTETKASTADPASMAVASTRSDDSAESADALARRPRKTPMRLAYADGFMTLPSPMDGNCLYNSLARAMSAWPGGQDDPVARAWFADRLATFHLTPGKLRGSRTINNAGMITTFDGATLLRRLVAMQFLLPHPDYDDVIDSMRSIYESPCAEEALAFAVLPRDVPTVSLTLDDRKRLFRACAYDRSYWGNMLSLTFLERVFLVRFIPFNEAGVELMQFKPHGHNSYPPAAYLALALEAQHYRMLCLGGNETQGMFSRLAIETQPRLRVLRPVLDDDVHCVPGPTEDGACVPYTPYEDHIQACFSCMLAERL